MAIGDDSRWRYVCTDLSGSTSYAGAGAVLNTSQKQFSNHLNAGRTAQFTINIDNPCANFLLTNRCLMKVYRQTRVSNTWQRMMVGDVIQVDESGQGDVGLLTVVASDPLWRVQRRLLGMAVNSLGQGTGYTDGTSTSLADYTTLVYHIFQYLESSYNLGLVGGTVTLTGNTSYLGPIYAQNAGDTLQQLLATLGAPEIRINPLEPYNGAMPNTIIGSIDIVPAIGQNQPNAIFEYGCGTFNVASYDRILTLDGLANQLYSLPQGFPDVVSAGDTMVYAEDLVAIAASGLFQDLVQGDLVSQPLRQELCNENLNVRENARQQITFVPTVNCPLDYTVDYDVGDTVQARAYANGTYRFNGSVRVYGIDMAIDDNDAETPTLTLIPTSEGS